MTDTPGKPFSDKVSDRVIDHTRLQLSALFDGELALDEARFLQRRLQHDPELGDCVSRWQLAGDILRGQATAPAPAGFAGRVAAAIAADAGQAASPATARRSRWGWGSGAALAASVAAVALFMARQAPDSLPAANAPQVEMASTTPATPAPTPSRTAPQGPDAAAQLAAATLAVAEDPRRAAARRGSSRAQIQRAAATRASRALDDIAQPQLAVAAAMPAATTLTGSANPFAPSTVANTPRPWPRALLPNTGAAFNVGYGELQHAAIGPAEPASMHPFRPRPAALQQEVLPSTSMPSTSMPSTSMPSTNNPPQR
jgi:negative regulator of sigma E activity